MDMLIFLSVADEVVFHDLAEKTKLEIKKQSFTGFGTTDILQYLTVGGGLAALVNCIAHFIEIKKGTRSIKIVKKNGEMIELTGMSKNDITDLLKIAEKVLIANIEESEEE